MIRRVPSGFFTDEADRLAQPCVGDVDRFSVCLGYHEDNIFGVQLALAGRGTTGNDADHLDIAVFLAQCSADAFQRTAHADVEVLLLCRRKVAGMGIESPRYGVEIAIIMVLDGFLENPREELLAAFQRFLPRFDQQLSLFFLVRGAGFVLQQVQVAVENLVFEHLTPAFPQFGLGSAVNEFGRVGFK
jgi:hypothetical protein